jgi:hypothetical protein
VQIPILSGVYTDEAANLRNSYPVNMIPVVMQSGISAGYLRTADGATRLGAGLGAPRGGINWNGELYRVSGTKLVKVAPDGSLTVLGDVGVGARCTLTYSFDRLAIASGGRLYYWDGALLTQVVDPDLGTCLDVAWIDGYFMSTDGEYLVVTDLANPLSVNPNKYGSSEIDPDPIQSVLKLRNEIWAVNRYTCEVFNNVGGELFPFQRVEGAQVQKGAIGTHGACVFGDYIAFLGSGRNETPAIYLAVNGGATKISTLEIDAILAEYAEVDLIAVTLEQHIHQSHPQLWIRLPDRTLVYDIDTSQAVSVPVWFQLTSSAAGFAVYRLLDPVWVYDEWHVCDALTGDMGIMTPDSAHHFGQVVRWEFATSIVYNEGHGVLWNKVELVTLNGRVAVGDDPVISTSYTLDGEAWSDSRPLRAGMLGDRMKRLAWFQQGYMRNWRAQRFCGDTKARLSVVRLDVEMEALAV